MMKTKIAQKMALAQTNGFFSAFRIPTSSLLLQTAAHMTKLMVNFYLFVCVYCMPFTPVHGSYNNNGNL